MQFAASQQINAPLKELIIKQSVCAHPPRILDPSVKAQVHQSKRMATKEHALEIRNSLSIMILT